MVKAGLQRRSESAGFRFKMASRATRRRRMRRFSAMTLLVMVVSLAGAAASLASSSTFTGTVSSTGTVSKSWSINVTDTGTKITASLDWTTTSANLDLFLVGPGSTATIAKSVTSNRPETISYQPTVTGTYKLRVKATSGTSAYTLNATYNTAPGGGGNPTPVPTNPATDWPMWHNDPFHLGVSADSTIGACNAAGLGLDWAVNTGSTSYISPVVYHSPTLNKTLVYVANQNGVDERVRRQHRRPSVGAAAGRVAAELAGDGQQRHLLRRQRPQAVRGQRLDRLHHLHVTPRPATSRRRRWWSTPTAPAWSSTSARTV